MFPALLPTYNRTDVAFVRGEGSYLFAEDGKRYLDFGAGIAVNAFGHAHPRMIKALTEQAGKLWHTSNLYRVPGQESLSQKLVDNTFADTCFFTNSGTEAIELAIKMARRYQFVSGHPERFHILSFEGAFHGRTYAAINAGGNEKYLEGFGPRMPGFVQLAAGDLEAVKKVIGPETAAVIIEPMQGEGGVRVMAPEFLRGLRKLCDDNGLLLVFDEVQTGVGRSGQLFAYQQSGVRPDIMALAKALGGGFPLGACLATAEAAKGMVAGTHGSTFGGNPLAMAAAGALLDVVLADGFLERVRRTALILKQKLAEIRDRHPAVIAEVRGEGLLVGLRAVVPSSQLVDELRAEKMITVAAGDNVVRLLPPLIVSEDEVAEAVRRIDRACARIAAALKAPQPQGAAG